MDVLSLLDNPLAQASRPSQYLRLVLAEAGKYGMPGDTIAMLDDVAAMLGFYDPLPAGQAAHLSAPLVLWRSHPRQPSIERIHEVEKLAFSQRALIAFGGAKPGQMVGTAEIVVAIGNTHHGLSPNEYYEVFQWASLDVLKTLTGDSEDEILADPKKKHWHKIADDDVLKPGGRLYSTYQEIATSIRREAIANVRNQPHHTRIYLRPIAAMFIEAHDKVRQEAAADGMTDLVERLDRSTATMRDMFPDLGTMRQEMQSVHESVERVTASD